MNDFEKDASVKILMLGAAACGKSTMVGRYKCGRHYRFYNDYSSTIMDEHPLRINEKPVTIIDFGGMLHFEQLREEEIEGADIFLVCYEVKNDWSFQTAEHYLNKILELNFEETLRATLVATKCDLSNCDVDLDRGAKLAVKYGIPFMKCSTKNGINITAVFETAYNQSFEDWCDESWPLSLSPSDQLNLKRTLEDAFRDAFGYCALDVFAFLYEEFFPFIVDIAEESIWKEDDQPTWLCDLEEGALPRGNTGRSSRSSCDIGDINESIRSEEIEIHLSAEQATIPNSFKLFQNVKVLDQSLWEDKERILQCKGCWERFSWPFTLKYNCRLCGHVFCSKCTKHQIQFQSVSGPSKQRVCKACWDSHSQ